MLTETTMVNRSWARVFICTILFCKPATCQSITRHSSSTGNDVFPNQDNSTCGDDGCIQANGYKSCLSCCQCTCNYGSYLTSRHYCTENFQLVEGCKFGFADNDNQFAITTSTLAMKNGQKMAYCNNKWNKCTILATNCILLNLNTTYDNGNWKLLWHSQSQVDFEIKRAAGDSDSLMWKSKVCNAKKYDGLLISLGMSCKVQGMKNRIESCLVMKFPGTFIVGTNPLMRTNCTTPTATTVVSTTATTKATVATTLHTTVNPVQTNLTSQLLSLTEEPPPTPKASNSGLILTVSLSTIGVLLAILFAVAVVITMKRRKKSSSDRQSEGEGNGKTTANSSSSQSPTILGMETNGDGDFVHSEEPPMFIVHVNEGFYDEPLSEPMKTLGEAFSNINTRGQNSAMEAGADYSKENLATKRPKIKSISSDGEEATSDDKIWLQDTCHIYSEPYSGEDSEDAIYAEPDEILRDAGNAPLGNDKNSEPVYMLYEPFHP